MTQMKVLSRFALLALAACTLSIAAHAQDRLTIGANVNMVSGGTFPEGDPFQRQQNEPSVAFSSRNNLHLLAGANDYRAVDVPGLPGGEETGDSWLSYFWSTNGGQTWRSTLIPGYPQDPACQTSAPPALCGYEAGADPVVRAGANGMFYYSGIVFDRADPTRSAIFVSRFIDLNNDEGGDPIRYIDTTIVDANNDGSEFLDKSWIGVDIPRGTVENTFNVVQSDDSTVTQTVACGNIYVGYASITGEDETLRSQLRLAVSEDCGDTWTNQTISEPDSLNQGANIGIDPNTGELHVAWRRFDTVETFLGVSPTGCPTGPLRWKFRQDWPTSSLTLGDVDFTENQARHQIGFTRWWDETYRVTNVLIAAKLNILTGGGDPVPGFNPSVWAQELTDLIDQTDAWLVDNPLGSFPRGQDRRDGKRLKRKLWRKLFGSGTCAEGGSALAGSTGFTNAIMIASSSDGGATFTAPQVISESNTFDQGGSRYSFRTTAYPTITVDDGGRIYAAWAARGFATLRTDPVEGDARIVISTSDDGSSWSAPYAIDEPNRLGHQIKPSILFAGGQLALVFYDFRQDVSNVFEQFVLDLPDGDRLRHTVDVRLASALPAAAPIFSDYSLISGGMEPTNPTSQASRYSFIAYGDAASVETLQIEYMPPNFPMFADGTTPFIGDYVDIAAPNLIFEGGAWRFATDPGDVQVWQAVWSDNRDVIPPPDGDWSKYVAPINVARQSQFDPTVTIPACSDVTFPDSDPQFQSGALYTGTRNQNIYSAAISSGVIVAAPGNNRPLGLDEFGDPLLRGFVVFVQNTTNQERTFEVSLPDTPAGVDASLSPSEALNLKAVVVPAFSSSVVTVYAQVEGAAASETIPVSVTEVGGTLAGSVVLNGDPTAPDPLKTSLLTSEIHNPAVFNPAVLNPAVLNATVEGGEETACVDDPIKCVTQSTVYSPAVFNPAVFNPAVFNPAVLNPAVFNPAVLNPAVFNPAVFNPAVLNPAVMNPAVLNPAVLNPAVFNPAVFNPAVLNPAVLNPAVLNPAVLNPAVLNPAVLNPAVLNPAVLNPAVLNPAVFNTSPDGDQVEVTFAIRNDGNATTAYDLDLVAPEIEGLDFEVLAYRLNETPFADGCTLTTEAQQQLIFRQSDPTNTPGDGSFYLEPGEEILVTLQVRPDVESPVPADPVASFNADDIGGVVVSQTPNTDPAVSPPPPPVDSFGPPTDAVPATAGGTLTAGGGTAPIVNTTLSAGDQVSITATGSIRTQSGPGSTLLGPDGDAFLCLTLCLEPSLPEGALIARIAGGPWQLVGSGPTVLTAPATGALEFAVNDAVHSDNTGAFGISVTPTSGFSTVVFTETPINDVVDIQSNGVFVVANNLGASPQPVVVNGVVFGTDQSGLIGPWGPGSGDFSVNPFAQDLDTLLSSNQFSGTAVPIDFTISGLTPGNEYRLQLLFANDLNTTGNEVDVTIDGTVYSLSGWQPGAINLSASFIASSTDVTVTFAPGAGATPPFSFENGRAILSGYVLHEGPFIDASITSVDINPSTLVIGGASAPFSADFVNNGTDTLSPIALQTWIDQPGGVFRAGGAANVFCGLQSGELPPGICSSGTGISAGNPAAAGQGTLVPGPATARIQLQNTITGNVLDTELVPITLSDPAPGPTITAASPNPMAPGIGQLVTFTIQDGPGLDRFAGDVVFARNEVTGVTTSTSNFIFGGGTVRLDDALRPTSGVNAATVWFEYANGDRTNDFSMLFSAIPAAPVITGVFTAPACFDSSGTEIDPAIDRLDQGDWIRIDAQGLDSSTARVDVLTTQAATATSSTAGLCPSTTGSSYWVQLPDGLSNNFPFTLQIRANQSPAGSPGDYATINLNQ